MFLNPQNLLDNKIITYPNFINPKDFIQQNGLDVDCVKLFNINFTDQIVIGKEKSHKPMPTEKPVVASEKWKLTGWELTRGCVYTFESNFQIKIPKDMCGWVIGRSTFNRQGILIRSSLYDQGYSGNISGTIYCFNNIFIEQGARIAQIVCSTAEGASMYDGQYQAK